VVPSARGQRGVGDGHVYAKRPNGVRRPCGSRLAFQIWPHAVQRQYVEALTALLVVMTSRELQNGHAAGATAGSVDGSRLYTWRALSALWIESLAEPLFGYRLIAESRQ